MVEFEVVERILNIETAVSIQNERIKVLEEMAKISEDGKEEKV